MGLNKVGVIAIGIGIATVGVLTWQLGSSRTPGAVDSQTSAPAIEHSKPNQPQNHEKPTQSAPQAAPITSLNKKPSMVSGGTVPNRYSNNDIESSRVDLELVRQFNLPLPIALFERRASLSDSNFRRGLAEFYRVQLRHQNNRPMLIRLAKRYQISFPRPRYGKNPEGSGTDQHVPELDSKRIEFIARKLADELAAGSQK